MMIRGIKSSMFLILAFVIDQGFLFAICCSSFLHCLSITIVPNGSREEINAFPNHMAFLLYSFFTSQARYTNAMNNTPCKAPTIVTAIGKSAKYFNGMATNSNRRKDIPSDIAIWRNQWNFVFIYCKSNPQGINTIRFLSKERGCHGSTETAV